MAHASSNLQLLHTELDTIQRMLAIRSREDQRPYMKFGSAALVPVKALSQRGQNAPLLAHIGCGIFLEKTDAEIQRKVSDTLQQLAAYERMQAERAPAAANGAVEDNLINPTPLQVNKQATEQPMSFGGRRLPPLVFERETAAAVKEHTATTTAKRLRKGYSQFAIDRL